MLNLTVSNALEGKYYSGSRGDGIIKEAHYRSDVWVSDGNAYAVRVRPTYNPDKHLFIPRDFWATVGVTA